MATGDDDLVSSMRAINQTLFRDAAAYLDRWLEYQQQFREIPALTVALRLDDELILSEGYGHANLEDATPVTPQHIFRVASHSKWFTATAIMHLKEQGKLRLDDSLAQHIPWLHDRLATVTIREVLNQAAGITRDGYDNDHWQLEHPFPNKPQLRKLVEEGGDVLPSNHKLKYSNIGYSLLGEVVEAASGRPYNDYMRENIIGPLGLENTGPETNPQARSQMVTGYSSRALLMPRVPLPDVETRAMSSATGFYSTAEDLSRFASAHFFANEELISDESKYEMQRPYWPVEGMDSYGLGMMVAKVGDRWVAGHSGGFPGHTTQTYLDPRDRMAISVLANETAGVTQILSKSMIKLIDLALKQKPAENEGDLRHYTGRFSSLWGYVDVIRLGDQLFGIEPASEDPASAAVKLEVIDDQTLKIEDKEGYGSPGELVRYFRDEPGILLKISLAGRTLYPAGANQKYLLRRRQELSKRGITRK